MRQSFKYRLYPNKAQQQMIEDALEHGRLLYNRLLAKRKEADEKSGTSLSYVAQATSLPGRKEAIPALHAGHSPGLQDVAKRLDKAFQGFFRRVKTREKPGYPRFKSLGALSFLDLSARGICHSGWPTIASFEDRGRQDKTASTH
jgi:putative transposase